MNIRNWKKVKDSPNVVVWLKRVKFRWYISGIRLDGILLQMVKSRVRSETMKFRY